MVDATDLYPLSADIVWEISQLDADIDNLDIEIEVLQRRLTGAQSTLEHKRLKRSRLKNILLPVNTLPNEIIQEIASYLQFPKNAVSDWEDSHPGVRTLAFVMTHVMHKWRTLLLNTPTLWSYIQIYPGQSLYLIRTCLTRAYNSPLFVSIICNDPLLPMPVMLAQIEALASTTHRWQYLSFHFSDLDMDDATFATFRFRDEPGYLLAPLNECTFPVLKSLHLDLCDTPWDAGLTNDVTPLLTSLAFNGTAIRIDTEVASRLTYLSIQFTPNAYKLTASELREILHSCSSLESMWLDQNCIDCHEIMLVRPAFIQIPTLTEMWLSADTEDPGSPPFIEFALKSFSCPTLKSLGFDHFNAEVMDVLLQVVSDTSATPSLPYANVTVLTIKELYFGSAEESYAKRLFTAFPMLKTLYLESEDVSSCLQILSRQPHELGIEQPLCPRLHTLSLPDLGLDNAAFVKNFIACRLELEVPLGGLSVDEAKFKSEVPSEIRDWMFSNVEVDYGFGHQP